MCVIYVRFFPQKVHLFGNLGHTQREHATNITSQSSAELSSKMAIFESVTKAGAELVKCC